MKCNECDYYRWSNIKGLNHGELIMITFCSIKGNIIVDITIDKDCNSFSPKGHWANMIHWANIIEKYTLCGLDANQIPASRLISSGDANRVTCPNCIEIIQAVNKNHEHVLAVKSHGG